MDIKKFGLKNTKAREGLIEIFRSQSKPIDAYESINLLKKTGINADQATIYRSLNVFAQKGLVREVHFNDGVIRYELSDKPEHHHAICVKCDRVEDIMDCSVEKLEKQILNKKGFSVVSHSLEFFGVCKNCKATNS